MANKTRRSTPLNITNQEELDEEESESNPPKRRRLSNLPGDQDEDSLHEESGIFTMEKPEDFVEINDLKPSLEPEAEAGIIEKIVLINFMCHTMLEVPLAPNVNFIIGRNGSGKSAIMTGIVVGLGGKANITNRGNSLKGFIKDKCSFCQIIITLKNRGKDAYCPETYGTSIIIERRITSDGNGSYKIKSCDGKTISHKKEELNNILDQFNIQADNPVSLLNQDTSRNFLNTSEPKDKYKLFLKGTGLLQLSTDYEAVLDDQSISDKVLSKKSEEFKETKKDVLKLEEKYKDIQQLKNIEEHIESLKRERVWAEVIELEKGFHHLEKEVEKQKSRRPGYEKKGNECQSKIESLKKEQESVESTMKAVTEESKRVQEKQSKIASELSSKRTTYRGKQSNLKKVQQDLSSARMDEKQLKDRLEEMKNISLKDLETERKKRQRELEIKRNELKTCQNQKTTTDHERQQLERAINNDKEKLQTYRNERHGLNKAIDSLQKDIQNLENSRGNRLRIFGAWFPELLDKIHQAVRRNVFHRAPVGPIGYHITLKNQRWALAVEACLKDYVFAFCCHDNHDKVALLQIMNQICPKNVIPKIIMGQFMDHMHDVSRNKPQCSYTTVLDELIIDNHIIANGLIDQLTIESVLLIDSAKEARDVMFSRPPQGTRRAFSRQGDEIIGGRSAKSYAYYRNDAKYLQQDVRQRLSHLRTELDEKKHSHQQLQQELSELEAKIKDNQGNLQSLKSKASKEQEIVDSIMMEITELEDYEEEDLPDVSTLEEDLVLYTQQVEDLEIQMSQIEEESESALEEVEKTEGEQARHKEKIQEVMDKYEPLKKEQDDLMLKIAEEETKRKHWEDKCKEVDNDVREAEMRLKEMENKVKKITHQATQYCERIQTTRTVKALEAEICQKEKAVQLKKQSQENHEKITKQYLKGKEKLVNIKETMKNIQKYHKRIEEAVARRCKAYEEFRSNISLRAKYFFIMLLSQRGYTGKMNIDHKNETLCLEVNVDHGSKKSSKNTKSLSGGERSFSTICFVMALWEAIETPFRCLDEFDVFMDMVNRRISMNMLLKAGKEQSNRQFILLTPQDMSAIEGGSTVKIFKLTDPER